MIDSRRRIEMCIKLIIVSLFIFNGITLAPAAATAQSPEEFVQKILRDRYLRSPIVVLVEDCNKLMHQTDYIWSNIKELPTGVDIIFVSYNSTGIVELVNEPQISQSIDFLKAKSHNSRCKSNFATFTAIHIATDTLIPYDSAIILMSSHPPNDPEMQLSALRTLVKKRSKLQIIWLDTAEVPGNYIQISKPTGGEVYEVDAEHMPLSNETNELEDEPVFILSTTIPPQISSDEDDKVLQRQVMIAVRRGIKDYLNLPIQVDSSMKALYITTSGSVHKASIKLPSGEVKELWLQNTTRVSTDMEVGTWILEAVGHNFNITVHATSALSYSASVGKRNFTNSSGKKIDLVRVQGEGKLEEVVLVDEMGKELTRLEHYNVTRQNSNDKIRFEDERDYNSSLEIHSDWQLPANKIKNKNYFVQVTGQDSSGINFTRLSSLKTRYTSVNPVVIELNEQSQISAQPGQTINLYFDVINNYNQPIDMAFYAQDNLNCIRVLQPRRQIVIPQTKLQVHIVLELQVSNQQATDIVTLISESYHGIITTKSYVYIGYQGQDNATPDIKYTTDGYCRDTLSPSVCYTSTWSLDATIQDDSGILRIRTIPYDLKYKSDFIAGTRDKVRISYTSSCCDTKVDIIAFDINGNRKVKTVDIERVWLSPGEITAIVLGVILALLILIIIIVLCIVCYRRRKNRNFLMHH